MEKKDIISSGLLELYALGLSSEEENRQVEEWLQLHPEVVKELDSIQEGLELYAMAHAVQPSADVKQKLMAEIGHHDKVISQDNSPIQSNAPVVTMEQSHGAKVYRMNNAFKWAAAACFILLLGSLALNYSYYNKYQEAATGLANVEQELDKQRSMASNMDEQLNVMTDKNAMPVSLSGTPHAPEASAKIFWMQNTGDVYLAPGSLPEAKPGMQYQLWAIIDGKPVDGGMVSNDRGETYHIQKMKSFGKVQAFAITLEKKGGSPTPDMKELYVMAKI